MLVHEVISEAINVEPLRRQFKKTLESNKDNLQKSRTVFGVTKTLRKLFPGVKFRFLSGTVSAKFEPLDDVVTINNADKLLSADTVRNNWDNFVKTLVELLTHEHIHKEQSARGGIKQHQTAPSTASTKQKLAYGNRLLELKDLYDEAKERNHTDIMNQAQKDIDSLLRKAKRQGVMFSGTVRNYLETNEEIMAYAETIADDLVSQFSSKQEALKALQDSSKDVEASPMLSRYRSTFSNKEKPLKRLYKQVVHFINQKTK